MAALRLIGASVALVGSLVASSGWIHYRDAHYRFSVSYPPSWHRAQRNLTPELAGPIEILSLGTGRLPIGGGRCPQFPINALQAIGTKDAFISIQNGGERLPPRPKQFRLLPTQTHNEVRDCMSGHNKPTIYWIMFEDHGRGLYALVALGRSVSSHTRADALAILNSLRFSRFG